MPGSRKPRTWQAALLCLVMVSATLQAQQTTSAEDLSITTATLPKAHLREAYRIQLDAAGGIPPFTWALTKGALPPETELTSNGVLSGVPTQLGEYPFVVTITDGSSPAQRSSQAFVLRVVAALLAEWSRVPTVTGSNIEGSIKVSNETEHDFDLTVIALAVNEIGRATALGYQHFTLKRDTLDFEIPFNQVLPPGSYDVNVDVVAEVPERYTIYRARLVGDHELDIAQSP